MPCLAHADKQKMMLHNRLPCRTAGGVPGAAAAQDGPREAPAMAPCWRARSGRARAALWLHADRLRWAERLLYKQFGLAGDI